MRRGREAGVGRHSARPHASPPRRIRGVPRIAARAVEDTHHHAHRAGRRRRRRYWDWNSAPTITSPSLSALGNCAPASRPCCGDLRTTPAGVYRFGDCEVDFDRAEVRRAEQPVETTALEFRLLSALIRARGRVLTREQLIEHAWGQDTHVGGSGGGHAHSESAQEDRAGAGRAAIICAASAESDTASMAEYLTESRQNPGAGSTLRLLLWNSKEALPMRVPLKRM